MSNSIRLETIEECAAIAEGRWAPESNVLGEEYILRHKIAADIRALAQKQLPSTQFKGDVHHG